MIKALQVQLTAVDKQVATFTVNDLVNGCIASSENNDVCRVILTDTGARSDFYDLGEFTSPFEAIDAVTDVYLLLAEADIKLHRHKLDTCVNSYFGKQTSPLDIIRHLVLNEKCRCNSCKTRH